VTVPAALGSPDATTVALPERPPGLRRSAPFFPEIESLRGIAIVLVVLYHTTTFLHPGDRPQQVWLPLAFVYGGHSGVELFFVLSGFLLSRPFLAALAGGRPVRLREFYARRALRILPLYWTAVAVATILATSAPADLLRGLPFLVFLNAIPGVCHSLAPFDFGWWSLATGVQFCLVLPALALIPRSPVTRRLATATAIVYGLAFSAFLTRVLRFQKPMSGLYLGLSLFGRAPLFAFGIAAAWLHQRHGDAIRAACGRTRWLCNGGADLALLGLLAWLGLLLRWVVSVGFTSAEVPPLFAWHLLEGALWAGILLLLLLAPLRTKLVLSNQPLRTLGLLAYSLYLVHIPLLLYVPAAIRLPNPWGFGVALIGCLAVSAVTHRFIERPFLVRKARIDG
jgi:peptidoglycan/LPS O-acetylase OafA/YrhL